MNKNLSKSEFYISFNIVDLLNAISEIPIGLVFFSEMYIN